MTNTDLYIDVDDGSFMKGAVEQVIQCRIVLKYSYVLGYYLCSDISNYDPTKSTIPLEKLESAKYLFEHQQELLEKNNELLSELTEDYCNNIYSSITVVASSASKSVATAKPVATTTTTAGVKSTSTVGSTATTPDKKIPNDELFGTPQTISEKRNRIINLTRITEKFMSHLLQSIGTDGNASKILELGEMDGIAGGMKGGIAGGGRGGRKDRMMVEGVEYDPYAYEEEEEEGDYEDEHIQQAIIESTRVGGVSGSSSSHATRVAVAAAGVSGSGSSGGIMSALWNTLTHPTSSATTAATTPAIAVPVATAVLAPAPTTTATTATTAAAVASPKSNSIRSKRTSSGNNK